MLKELYRSVWLVNKYIYIYWLVVSTPLKNMKVSWDDYSQYMESHKTHVPNHQPVKYISHTIFNQIFEFTSTNTIKPYKPR